MKKLALFLLIFAILALLTTPLLTSIYAQTMTNNSYTIEEGNFNSFSGEANGPNYTVSDTGGGLAPGIYEGTNYRIRANFGYGDSTTSANTLSFAISNTAVNFGKIIAGEPITRANTLTVSSPNTGYSVNTSENHPLAISNGITIPDTTCDQGNCTQALAGIWASPLSYGFGYRCDNLNGGSACSPSFSTTNYYKQFANSQASESSQMVMGSTNPVNNTVSQITYKLNVAGNQAAGIYQNVIEYIAVPSL